MWTCITRNRKHVVRICVIVVVFLLFRKRFLNLRRDVPNVVHYVIFGETPINFIAFLSVVSTLKVQRPRAVQIHSDHPEVVCSGRYWGSLRSLSSVVNVPLTVIRLSRPTHVFGQRLSSIYHSSDVSRIVVLYENGGIYVDTDVLILKPLDEFFSHDVTLSWSDASTVGNQVLIAKKGPPFLLKWLNGYKNYKPAMWYYNAGRYPAELLEDNPKLVNPVNGSFGVQNLLEELYEREEWSEWKNMHALHLLSRHPPAPQNMDAEFVQRYEKSFGEIARKLLFEIRPSLVVKDLTWAP